MVAHFLAQIAKESGVRKIYAPEAVELLATADERRAQARDAHAGLLHRSERDPGCERLALTLRNDRGHVGIGDRTVRRRVCSWRGGR